MISAFGLSSPHSSGEKRVAPGDSVARPSGGPSPGDVDYKRQRRQGNPVAMAPRTPTSFGNAGNLVIARAASRDELLHLQTRVRSVNDYIADVDRSSHRLANGLEDVEGRLDWLESPQAMQQRVADLERQVAQLQGQLDLLVRIQPYGSRPVAMPPLMDLPPATLQPLVPPHPAAPQYPALGLWCWASAPCCLACPTRR
ncbi:hypothetical protein DVH05_020373 [Phytophthora capsici]|nr:hypothetical protein DVH05_020373 [Phytophthora capsici]